MQMLFFISGVAASFNGRDSHVVMEINMVVVPFGESGGFMFRTRDQTTTLMFVGFYNKETLKAESSLEFSLYKSQLQVTLSSNTCKLMLILSQTSPGFYMSAEQVFLKHCGKRGNCLLQAISPFPTVVSTHLKNVLPFSSKLKLSSANSFCLEVSEIFVFVKG